MCLEIADMLFGPSDPFGLPICLFARDSHGFDSCLDELRISKCFLQNKYSSHSINKSAGSISLDIFQTLPQPETVPVVEKAIAARGSKKCVLVVD
jgi:hypothetical protein